MQTKKGSESGECGADLLPFLVPPCDYPCTQVPGQLSVVQTKKGSEPGECGADLLPFIVPPLHKVAWGVAHFEPRSFERPQFECWHNASTGEGRYYPEWRRTAKRALSLLVTLLQTLFLTVLTLLIYLHYVNAVESYTGIQKTLIASALNGLMYGAIIMGLELLLFGAVSRVLTEFENYKTQSEFESAYIFKMFFFVWVDGYLWYWILGLVHIPIVREHSGPDGRIDPAFARETTIFGWRVFNEGTTTLDEWIHSFETSVTFQVAGSNTLILALENLLPVLWVWLVRARWNAHIKRARRGLDWPLLRRVLPSAARGGPGGAAPGGQVHIIYIYIYIYVYVYMERTCCTASLTVPSGRTSLMWIITFLASTSAMTPSIRKLLLMV